MGLISQKLSIWNFKKYITIFQMIRFKLEKKRLGEVTTHLFFSYGFSEMYEFLKLRITFNFLTPSFRFGF
jgi:hypothetical protein